MNISSIQTIYGGTIFKSKLEAQWAVVFDKLGIPYTYEPDGYELGPKNIHGEYDLLQEDLEYAYDEKGRREIKREIKYRKEEKLLYIPDFWIADLESWVEIKGREPLYEEKRKAQLLSLKTREPVHILWGEIPDPRSKELGKQVITYGENENILDILVSLYGNKEVREAFRCARQESFNAMSKQTKGTNTSVQAIIQRLRDLDIMIIIRGEDLVLRAKPGVISEKCKQVVRENKAAIIEHLTKLESVPFEHKIAAIFPGGCKITTQPVGTTLAEHVAALHAAALAETHVSRKEKKPNWTTEQWQDSEELQYQRVREYQERLGTPIPVEESYMGTDGCMVVPSFRKMKEK